MGDREEPAGREIAVLAGGCFWCLEAVYDELDGVESVESGYTGGHLANPTYEEVCSELTGHAEAVRITFDPARIRYEDLLDIFFDIHDPTTLNRQEMDIGTQYRSAIYYLTPHQRAAAEQTIAALTAQGAFPDPIVTEVTEAGPFYRAEPYHDDYFRRNPTQGYCRVVIAPKVAKFRNHFGNRLKPSVTAQTNR
jgi:peptide-methionine (S)-S-oxide reductase